LSIRSIYMTQWGWILNW